MLGFCKNKKVSIDKIYQVTFLTGCKYNEKNDEISFSLKNKTTVIVAANNSMDAITKLSMRFPLYPNTCILKVERVNSVIV